MINRIDPAHLQSVDKEELLPEMLRTIRIPSNLKQLSENLPKPNYEPLKLTSIGKANFIEGLAKSKANNKQSSSLTTLKPSGQGRRRSPKLKPHEGSTEEGDSSKQYNSEHGGGENSSNTRGGVLPIVNRKVPMTNLELKLKYLSRKKVENQYHEATNSANAAIEDYKKLYASPGALNKKYDQLMNDIRT